MVLIFAEQQTNAGFHAHAKYPAQQQAQQLAYPYGSQQQQPQMYDNTYAQQPQQQAIEKSKYILAERYKSKMCRTFMATGTCPYHHRCMFAHGQHELRTTDMNVRDGLMTEEAIRSFQRAMTAYNRGEGNYHGEEQHSYYPEQQYPQQHNHDHQQYTEGCPCDDCAAAARATQHNPYYSAMPQAFASQQQ